MISCRDAALALSKCAGWFSVRSVTSVLKKRLGPSLALPVGAGEAGAVVERNETFNVLIFVPGTGR